VEFLPGELEVLPLERGSVDATVSLLVLHHVEQPELAIAEMARVLRTSRGGGVALVVDMLRHSRAEYRLTMGHKHLGFDPETIGAWMSRAGLERVRLTELAREPEGKGPGLFAAAGWNASS
jgi:ArsR family transcriptional regulator